MFLFISSIELLFFLFLVIIHSCPENIHKDSCSGYLRERSRLVEVLKSKHEETEAYLSEIEAIGQAYDDMQAQNQQLFQQITERDDYNIKLVLEGVRARQQRDCLAWESQTTERAVEDANTMVSSYEMKADKIDDQLRGCSDLVQKHAEDRVQNSLALENTQKGC